MQILQVQKQKTIVVKLYDHEGNRFTKKEYIIDSDGNNKTTYYVNENFIHIRLTNGTVMNETYYYGEGKLLAKKDNEGNKFYYHPDHLGSTTLVTNQTGGVVEEIVYLPYGGSFSGSEDSRFLYTGKEKDKDTGFSYYGARYYDSDFRRFISPDPIIADIYDPQNLNRYAYVLNNPYKYTDPTGNEPVSIYVIIEAAIDVASLVYSAINLGLDPESDVNKLALSLDLADIITPISNPGPSGIMYKSGVESLQKKIAIEAAKQGATVKLKEIEDSSKFDTEEQEEGINEKDINLKDESYDNQYYTQIQKPDEQDKERGPPPGKYWAWNPDIGWWYIGEFENEDTEYI